MALNEIPDLCAQKPSFVLKNDLPVMCLCFSRDGKVLASDAGGGKVRLWSTKTWMAYGQLQPHKGDVIDVEFLDDHGSELITASDGGQLHKSQCKSGIGASIEVGTKGIAVSPCGKYVAVANGTGKTNLLHTGGVRSDRRLGDLWKTFEGISGECCRFSDDGKFLGIGGGKNCVQVWHVGSAKRMANINSSDITSSDVFSIAFSKDNALLAYGASDGFCRLYDLKQQKQLASWMKEGSGGVSSVIFDPANKNRIIAASADGFLRFWEADRSEPVKEFKAHDKLIWRITVTADGNWLGSSSDDQTIKIWRLGR